MKRALFLALAWFLFTPLLLLGEELKVFVASSARYALDDIKKAFLEQNPKARLEIITEASGAAYAKFGRGFPYDLFLSADMHYPKEIEAIGEAAAPAKPYAKGALALYTKDPKLLEGGMEALGKAKFSHLAIANPKLAPYGVAAMETLTHYQLKEAVESKIVLGNNISQAAQFVDSGAAEVGLIAYSLIVKKQQGVHLLIDSAAYTPITHGFVITKRAKDNPLAWKLAAFLTSPRAQEIFKEYGFFPPDVE